VESVGDRFFHVFGSRSSIVDAPMPGISATRAPGIFGAIDHAPKEEHPGNRRTRTGMSQG
jgi:hypothetical protein